MLRHSGRRIGFGLAVIALVSGAGLMLRAEPPQEVGTWASIGASPEDRVGATSVALPDGRTVIAGGLAGGIPTDAVVLFDPETGSFSAIGQLTAPRTGHTATLLEDGSIMIAGGTVNELLTADIEIYDLSTGTATPAATMTELRSGHAAARLPNGSVLIAGGIGPDGALQSAEIFDPAAGTSAVTSPLLIARTGASATSLIDGRVLIAGGSDGTQDLASAEIFDQASQSFQSTDTNLAEPRSGHTAVLLPHNSSVLIAGGSSNGMPLATVDLFVPAEFPDPYSYGMGQFAPTDEMAAPRSGAAGGPHVEGYAYVTGGGAADAEVYRFATIKTDKDDYAPEQTAIITGSGWQPNEDVTLRFQEDPAVHDDYVLTVTADGEGNIHYDQWAPEWHDLGVRFYLMARQGELRAQTTFTDNISIAFDNTASDFAWHRTNEVPNGFNVAVGTPGGRYSCTSANNLGDCDSVTNIQFTVPGVTGFKNVTVSATGNNVSWPSSISLTFRNNGTGDFLIPPGGMDGQWDLVATLTYTRSFAPAGTFTSPDTVDDFFGVDDTPPVTAITCNNNPCAGLYAAAVTVKLNDADAGSGVPNNGGSVDYCIDDSSNDCVPNIDYPGNAGFSVPFAAGTTAYVRYRSTDNLGNVEATKSQAIQFQAAATVSITVNTTPAGRSFTVDGTSYTTAQTFSWTPGSNHTIATTSPQSGGAVTQYLWTTWSDGGAISHTVTAPSSATTYTATFKTQRQVSFTTSGVGGDTGANTVLNLQVNSDPAVNYTQATLPTNVWYDDGTTLTYSYTPYVDTDPAGTTRYRLTGTSPTSPQTVAAGLTTITGTYVVQRQVSFTTSGVDGDTGANTVLNLQVNSDPAVNYTQATLPTNVWYDDGTTLTYSYTPYVDTDPASAIRYRRTGTNPSSPQVVGAALTTITGTYVVQRQVSFTTSGVGGDTGANTVLNLQVNSDPAVNYTQATLPTNVWYDDGTALTYSYTPYVDTDPAGTTRYRLTGTSPTSPQTVAAGLTTITGTYVVQRQVSFTTSGVGGDTGANTVLNLQVNSDPAVNYTQATLPTNVWYDDGTALTYSYTPYVDTDPAGTKRYRLTGTSPTSPQTVAAGLTTITGTYVVQWAVTFSLTGPIVNDAVGTVATIKGTDHGHGDFPVTEWVDDDTSISFDYKTPIGAGAGKRYVLTATSHTSPQNNVTGPLSISGTYKTQYEVTWRQTGLAGTGANTVVTIPGLVPAAKTLAALPFLEWFDDGATVNYAFSTPISTDPVSSTQFELTNSPGTSLLVSAPTTITGAYTEYTYTIQYLSPLDQSNGTGYIVNTGKNGRVIPVKVLIFKNGVAISDTSTVIMRVMGSTCTGGTPTDLVEEYADAGASNGNTNLFRWSSPHWIYNLDTKALGLAINSCYRLDVYLNMTSGPTAIKASSMTWAIFKPVK